MKQIRANMSASGDLVARDILAEFRRLESHTSRQTYRWPLYPE